MICDNFLFLVKSHIVDKFQAVYNCIIRSAEEGKLRVECTTRTSFNEPVLNGKALVTLEDLMKFVSSDSYTKTLFSV
ncbi:hypothetical protein [Bartonella sp. B41]